MVPSSSSERETDSRRESAATGITIETVNIRSLKGKEMCI